MAFLLQFLTRLIARTPDPNPAVLDPRSDISSVSRSNADGSKFASEPSKPEDSSRSSRTKAPSSNFKSPEDFVTALQQAAELWHKRETLEKEASDLWDDICNCEKDLEYCRVRLERFDGKTSDAMIEGQREEIRSLEEVLEGPSGLYQEKENVNRLRIKTKSSQAQLFKKIFQGCQKFVDESRDTNMIGRLNVGNDLPGTLITTAGCAVRIAALGHDYTRALTHWQNMLKELRSTKQTDEERTSETYQDLARKEAEAEAEFRRMEQKVQVHDRLEQFRQFGLMKTVVIPALHASGLLDTTAVPPSAASISVASSGASLEPLERTHQAEPAHNSQEPNDMRRRLDAFIQCQKDHQFCLDDLEEFKSIYSRNKITYLVAYSTATSENYEAYRRQRQKPSYEEVCARKEAYIEKARQALERATNEVLDAGLELPIVPPPEDKMPVLKDKKKRDIRKFARDVARGKVTRLSIPRSSPRLPSGSSIRNLPTENSGDPERVAMIRQYEPTRAAIRAEAMREYRQRSTKAWLDRMKYSKGVVGLKDPPLPKKDPWAAEA